MYIDSFQEFSHGQGTGTATAAPVSQAPSRVAGYVEIRTPADNTGPLAIGGPSVSLINGYLLGGDGVPESIRIPIDSANKIHVVGDGQAFSWLAF